MTEFNQNWPLNFTKSYKNWSKLTEIDGNLQKRNVTECIVLVGSKLRNSEIWFLIFMSRNYEKELKLDFEILFNM